MTYVLWIIQALLALLFLFAGGTKLIIPPDVLASMGSPNQIPLPGLFVRFVGVAEVLGALGLLPLPLPRERDDDERAGGRHVGALDRLLPQGGGRVGDSARAHVRSLRRGERQGVGRPQAVAARGRGVNRRRPT
jgi:hypothetical protein